MLWEYLNWHCSFVVQKGSLHRDSPVRTQMYEWPASKTGRCLEVSLYWGSLYRSWPVLWCDKWLICVIPSNSIPIVVADSSQTQVAARFAYFYLTNTLYDETGYFHGWRKCLNSNTTSCDVCVQQCGGGSCASYAASAQCEDTKYHV